MQTRAGQVMDDLTGAKPLLSESLYIHTKQEPADASREHETSDVPSWCLR